MFLFQMKQQIVPKFILGTTPLSLNIFISSLEAGEQHFQPLQGFLY